MTTAAFRSGAQLFKWAILSAALSGIPAPVLIAAQEGCGLGEGSSQFVQETIPGEGTISYFSTPHFVCEDDVEIWADSAVTYSADAMSNLIGSVRYIDRNRELRSDNARYFSDQGRLQAQGRVVVIDTADGSEVRNGNLVYLRVTDFRPEEELTITTGADGVRPEATFLRSQPTEEVREAEPPDGSEPTGDHYKVTGDRIFIRGGSHLASTGNTVIERDSLTAFANRAVYDRSTDELLLDGEARVESSTYDLAGQSIVMTTREDESDEVRARTEASLTSESLHVTAPEIVVHLDDGTVRSLVAIPLSGDRIATEDSIDSDRPIATADDFEVTADSLEMNSPFGALESIFASGSARSVSHARNALNVESLPSYALTDWLEGDTVVVTFRPRSLNSAEVDATSVSDADYEVEQIVARVGARSFYRLLPTDSSAQAGIDPPALHYVVGDEIRIHMNAGEVESMEVLGQSEGIHLEPLSGPQDGSNPDSIGSLSDSTSSSPVTDSNPMAGDRVPSAASNPTILQGLNRRGRL